MQSFVMCDKNHGRAPSDNKDKCSPAVLPAQTINSSDVKQDNYDGVAHSLPQTLPLQHAVPSGLFSLMNYLLWLTRFNFDLTLL